MEPEEAFSKLQDLKELCRELMESGYYTVDELIGEIEDL